MIPGIGEYPKSPYIYELFKLSLIEGLNPSLWDNLLFLSWDVPENKIYFLANSFLDRDVLILDFFNLSISTDTPDANFTQDVFEFKIEITSGVLRLVGKSVPATPVP